MICLGVFHSVVDFYRTSFCAPFSQLNHVFRAKYLHAIRFITRRFIIGLRGMDKSPPPQHTSRPEQDFKSLS